MKLSLRFTRMIAFVLALAFIVQGAAFALQTPDAASAKQMITRRGVGAKVKIHETDGSILRGRIMSLNEDSFRIQTGHKPEVEVPFASVRDVNGHGLSRGTKIGIGVGVAAATGIGVTAIIISRSLRGPILKW